MSTNPFRQTRNQQEQPSQSDSRTAESDQRRVVPDGGGTRVADLSINTKVPPSSLDRHVSFASPPVDTAYPAISYPSSPESTRSPPPVHIAQPVTPDYSSALQSDPFRDLGRHGGEDYTIQEALSNTQNNAAIGQSRGPTSAENTVRNNLSRFAAAPTPSTQPVDTVPARPSATARQSLDVDAFKRLLLTGDSARSLPGSRTPSVTGPPAKTLRDSSSGTDTTSLSQQSVSDAVPHEAGSIPTPSLDQDLDSLATEQRLKSAPPAPAPRRGKSVKAKAPPLPPSRDVSQLAGTSSDRTDGKLLRKPPTPPLSRQHSHRSPSIVSDEGEVSSMASSSNETQRTMSKPPPPPPMRRQHSISYQRRTSNDLSSTVEETEPESATISTRRVSNDRPTQSSSRSAPASNQTHSIGHLQPPPLPPPRKGRGSNRSSMDSYRPSLGSIIGDGVGQENESAVSDLHRTGSKEEGPSTSYNADTILAELANLRKEVEAARRVA